MTKLRIVMYAGARRAESKAITDLIHCPKHDNGAGASLKVDVALPPLERLQGSPASLPRVAILATALRSPARRASSVFIPEGAFDKAHTCPRHLPFESRPAQTETTTELVVGEGRSTSRISGQIEELLTLFILHRSKATGRGQFSQHVNEQRCPINKRSL